jgi:hypothetical protein
VGQASEVGADVFDDICAACADVATRARHVRIDDAAIQALATTLRGATDLPLLPEEHPSHPGDEDATVAQVVAWNAVNFGSGWFPALRKRPGLSGARSLASAFADHVAEAGVPAAGWLASVDTRTCARIFEQPYPGPVDELLDLFAQAWRDLGALLLGRFDGSAGELVRAAGGSAASLVTTLASMPLAHDIANYEGRPVPFFKRAQITVSHLERALGGEGLGRFKDVNRLTAFADNLVPHVLRMAGVLVYDDGLSDRIEREELLEPGGAEEVEIRGCGLHAVELLAERAGRGSAAGIDHRLWRRGQDPTVKAVPRHRCRCSWY